MFLRKSRFTALVHGLKTHGNTPDGGAGGSNGAVAPAAAQSAAPPTGDSPDIAALVARQVQEQVAALKAHNERLIAENKANKEKLSSFEGVDLDQYRNFMSQMENDEETKLIAHGKISEVVERRTQRMKEQFELNLKKKDEEAQRALKERDTFKANAENILLDTQLRNAAITAGVNPRALDDVIARGKRVFKVTDGNKLEARDANGLLMTGNDATNSMTPEEFVDSLRQDHSYYWMANTPAGLTGMAGLPATDASAHMLAAAQKGDQAAYQAYRRKQIKGV
jgi:hypothetical protein